jgi:hypothetical protein
MSARFAPLPAEQVLHVRAALGLASAEEVDALDVLPLRGPDAQFEAAAAPGAFLICLIFLMVLVLGRDNVAGMA